jgi:hypothetical protein
LRSLWCVARRFLLDLLRGSKITHRRLALSQRRRFYATSPSQPVASSKHENVGGGYACAGAGSIGGSQGVWG